MPLRYRVMSNPETVQDLELAAEMRFWEGMDLFMAGHNPGAVYLLGYTAEMLLKRACFLFDRQRPAQQVGPQLGTIKAWAKRAIGVSHEGYHSVWFWWRVLQEKRRLAGRALPHLIDSRTSQAVRRLYGIWTVEMRYQPCFLTDQEVRAVYDDVTWLRLHWRRLGT